MKTHHLNKLMLIFSIIGGIIGYIIGEVLINCFMYRLPSVLLIGIYFSVFSLCVVTMCFISECLKPRLTVNNWIKDNFKINIFAVIPIMVVVMFAVGSFTQFIYGLNTKSEQAPEYDDYVFLMDNSGSMGSSDPDNLRISQIDALIDELDSTKRIGYYAFGSDVDKAFDLQQVSDSAKKSMHEAIYKTQSDGGTNIENALVISFNDIKSKLDPNRTTALILISDGEDDFDVKPIINQCKSNNVLISCIGLGINVFDSGKIMSQLADGTGGSFYDIQSADQIIGVFSNIKNHTSNTRLLLTRRYASERKNALYGTERVMFISLFGILIGLALGLIFDNKQLAKNLIIGGIVTGLLAGLTMELGLFAYFNTRFCRLFMDLLLSIVVCLFTTVTAYEISQSTDRKKYTKNVTDGVGAKFSNNSDNFDNTIMRF